jgi:ElaB/YqjD/DUF883 family membrane-anchored ribosome-binding protein
MTKNSNQPQSISEAIRKLEGLSENKVKDFKDLLEKDYHEIRKSLDDLKPYLDDLKDKVESEINKNKSQVETSIKENPWVTLGIVGVVAFVLGWIFGQNKK